MNLWRSLRGLPKAIWVLAGALLVNRAGSMILPFLVLYGTRDRGLSAERAGLLVTVFGLGALTASPIAGWLADRIPPIRIMQSSLLVGGLAAAVLPATRGFTALAVGIFVWSVLSESYRAPSLAIIGEITTPEQRKPAFALIRLAVNLGLSIGPVVGGLLAERSFPALFIVDGVTTILAGIVLVVFARRMDLGRKPPEEPGTLKAPVRRVLRDRRYLAFVAAMIPVLCVFFQCFGGMVLYVVRDLNVSTAMFGLVLAINTVLIVFFDVPVNTATVRWPHGRALFLGCALVGAGYGALAFSRSVAAVCATVVVWTLGEIFMFGALNAVAADLAPPARRGEYMGLFQVAFSGAFLIGPGAGIFVLERLGPAVLWGGCFAVALVSGVLLSRISTGAPERAPA